MSGRLESPVTRGAAVTLAVFWPVYALVWAVRRADPSFRHSPLWAAAVVVALVVAPVAGGVAAGARRPGRGTTTGAAAAVVGFGITALVGLIRAGFRSDTAWGPLITSAALFAVVFACLGAAGGYVAFRRSLRQPSPS